MRGVPTGQYMAQRKPGRLRGHFLRIGGLERSTAQFMSQNCCSILAIGVAAGLGGRLRCQTGPEIRKCGQKVLAASGAAWAPAPWGGNDRHCKRGCIEWARPVAGCSDNLGTILGVVLLGTLTST